MHILHVFSIFLMLLVVPKETLENRNLTSFDETTHSAHINIEHIAGAAEMKMHSPQTHGFFVANDMLYLILWKSTPQASCCGVTADSYLASTPLGHNTWKTIFIPGNAYFLEVHNEILTFEDDGDRWKMARYDLMGKPLQTAQTLSKKRKGEFHCFLPTPFSFPDRSLALYRRYDYEVSHPIPLFFRLLLSGGHGFKFRGGAYLQRLPLSPSAQFATSPLTYLKITDASFAETLIGLPSDFTIGSIPLNLQSASLPKTKDITYELSDDYMYFYKKRGTYIMFTPTGISISSDMKDTKRIAISPDNSRDRRKSYTDISVDAKQQDIVYVSLEKFSMSNKPHLKIFFYNHAERKWTTSILTLSTSAMFFSGVRVYWWQDVVYIGIWRDDDIVTILQIELADIKEGLRLTFPLLSHGLPDDEKHMQ